MRISKSQVLRSSQVSPTQPSHTAPIPEAKKFSPNKLKLLPTISFSYFFFFFPTGAWVAGRWAKEVKLSWVKKALHIYSPFPQHFLHTLQLAVFHFLICISSQNNLQAHLQNSGHLLELPTPSSIIYYFPYFPIIFKALLLSLPLLLCLLTLP